MSNGIMRCTICKKETGHTYEQGNIYTGPRYTCITCGHLNEPTATNMPEAMRQATRQAAKLKNIPDGWTEYIPGLSCKGYKEKGLKCPYCEIMKNHSKI